MWLPAAIRYEIPYDVFENINPRILNIYQENYIKKLEEKQAMIDAEAWLQGQYNMMAVGAAMSKKVKYPKKPHGIGEKEGHAGLSGEDKFLLWCDEFNHRFETKNS